MRRTVIVIALLSCAASVAQADVWRWVDPAGEVHYSDRPIEGAELVSRTTPITPTPNSDNPPESTKPGIPSTADANAQVAAGQAQREVNADVAVQRAKQCDAAKQRYQKSIQARRIYRTTPSGEREYLSDADADQIRTGNFESMTAACGTAKG